MNECPKISTNYSRECANMPSMQTYLLDASMQQINNCLYSALINYFDRVISDDDYKRVSLSINNHNLNSVVSVDGKSIGEIKQYWNNLTLITEFISI